MEKNKTNTFVKEDSTGVLRTYKVQDRTSEELGKLVGKRLAQIQQPNAQKIIEDSIKRELDSTESANLKAIQMTNIELSHTPKRLRKFDIYHAIEVGKRFTEMEHQHRVYVGSVKANSVEQAYVLSQNVDKCWTELQGELNGMRVQPQRSTSVGDVILDNNDLYLVCGCGFKAIGHVRDEDYDN